MEALETVNKTISTINDVVIGHVETWPPVIREDVIAAFNAAKSARANILCMIPNDSEENALEMWKSQLQYIKLLKAAAALANTQEPYMVKLSAPSYKNECQVVVNDRKRPAIIDCGLSSVRLNYLDSSTWKSQDGIGWICINIQLNRAHVFPRTIRLYNDRNYDPHGECKPLHIFLEHSEKFLEAKIAESIAEDKIR